MRAKDLRMKAVRVHEFGAIDNIVLDDIPVPDPGANEVLVAVKAAGVGPWDALVRSGNSGLQQPLPVTLGSDIAGIVERVGSNVVTFNSGDHVFGIVNERFTGGYAEYAAAQSDTIAIKPAALSFVEAASVPVIAVTAEKMLFEHAHVEAGAVVLVHGGAGNVGAYLVQLAHRAGARVIATAGENDVDYVRRLGADQVINYRTERFDNVVSNVDAVMDTVGGGVQERSFKTLKRGGILVSVVSPPDEKRAAAAGVRTAFFIVSVTTGDLTPLAALFEANGLKTEVGTVLPLSEARKAHEMLAGTVPHARGKIVLEH